MDEPKYESREARIIGDGLWKWLKQPCGECHIPPGTGSDICGAKAQPVKPAAWHGLTPSEIDQAVGELVALGTDFVTPLYAMIEGVERKLKERNAGVREGDNHDSIALETAQEIALMWGRDRTQFVAKIQVAVRAAMHRTAADAARLDWLLPNLHPANFGLEFPGGYEWADDTELLRKWREAIDAEIGAGGAYGKTNHTEKHTVSEADIDAEIRRSGCLRTDENRVVIRARLERPGGVPERPARSAEAK